MKLSIVIPAFNECGKIGRDVESACEFLLKNSFDGEVIVADDGSSDTTADEAQKAGDKYNSRIRINVIRNRQHYGKGYAERNPAVLAAYLQSFTAIATAADIASATRGR